MSKNQALAEVKAFENEFCEKEKEILILTNDGNGGRARAGKEIMWQASAYFLAYVDVAANELRQGDGRVTWLLSDEECKGQAIGYPYNFSKGTVYRLKVRELIDKNVPQGRIPAYTNRFMMVEILEKDVPNDDLQAVLTEYRKPVIISDKDLGEFELNKDYNYFEGEINWLGESVGTSLEVDSDDEASWTQAFNALRCLFEQQAVKDSEFRAFAAAKLVKSANDWREDEETSEITAQDFIGRIKLVSLMVTCDKEYVAFYDDGDMFARHSITVYGSLDGGVKSAQIEG